MKYYICIVFILFVIISGCRKPAEPVLASYKLTQDEQSGKYRFVDSSGEPVLIVAGQKITSNDILNEPASVRDLFIKPSDYLKDFAQNMEWEQFKAQQQIRDLIYVIVTNKLFETLLYESAKKQFGDNLDESVNKAVDAEIRRFVQQFGGDQAKADEAIKNKWIDRESYKKELKKDILSQWYISSQQTPDNYISYRQLKNQYESMKNENFKITPMIEFRLIDIIPSRLEIKDPNQNRDEYAENLANEIYTRLKAGEDFAELAREYSNGHRKQYGGLWDPLNPDSLASPYDLIAKAAQNMNPGEISQPIKADFHIFIFKLEAKRSAGYVPFEDVQDQVKQALKSEQKENAALEKLNESVIHQMQLDETNEFIDFCLEKVYKISNQEKK